ncbi:sensor histidine kinase [Streptomyces mauvecolor]|uniref:sensor histidine kinase n=1 Tax=Streptomyces sp. HUAS TT7 TaxID=3447507 RepID=UPI003F658191
MGFYVLCTRSERVPLGGSTYCESVRWWLRDWLGAAVVFALVIALPILFKGQQLSWTQGIAATVGCGALVVRRRRPLVVLCVVLAATLVSMYSEELVFPMALMTIVALYRVGRSCSLPVVVTCTCISVAAVYITTDLAKDIEHFDVSSANQLGWFVVAAAAGVVVENQHRFRTEADERAARMEQSREVEARRRVSEERLRIAQELHDVIGHNIAVINVQAGVASHLIGTRPERAQESLELIRLASSGAMEEIRTTLGLLRATEGEGPPAEPAPGFEDVPALVSNARGGGLEVTYRLLGDGGQVPVVIGSTVYRLIQESLTNVVKHAGPGARVDVGVRMYRGGLEVTVEDDGEGAGGQGGGSGLGLQGMRERVEAVGGTLQTSPLRPRGFRVMARIPTEAP